MGGTSGQTVDPMNKVDEALMTEFAPDFMPSMSVAYAFNRELPMVSSRTTGWTPMADNDAYADSMFNRCKLSDTAIASVGLTSTYDAATRTVSGQITASFEQAPGTGDYRLGLYVIESGITGPIPNYRQYSDYAMPAGYDDSYVFNDVLRAAPLGGSIWGEAGSLPADPVVGEIYTANFSYTLPDLFYDIAPVPSEMILAGFVTSYNAPASGNGFYGSHGTIYNAARAALTADNVPTVAAAKASSADFKASISNHTLTVTALQNSPGEISVLNLSGRTIASQMITPAGMHRIDLGDAAAGVLIVQFKAEGITQSQILNFLR